MNVEERAELRRLAEAATAGPWKLSYDGTMTLRAMTLTAPGEELAFAHVWLPLPWRDRSGSEEERAGYVAERRAEIDAQFIAAARNAIVPLLNALDTAEHDNAELRAELRAQEDAAATLYAAFDDAATARDHAVAQVMIQNGETSRAGIAAGVQQQRADRAEAERDRLAGQLAAVRELHQPAGDPMTFATFCVTCKEPWIYANGAEGCPTFLAALAAAPEEEPA